MATSTYELNSDGWLHTEVPGHGWKPVYAWAKTADGTRQITDQQERNENGEALWSRYAYLNKVSYGRVTPEMIEIRRWSRLSPDQIDLLNADDIFEEGE